MRVFATRAELGEKLGVELPELEANYLLEWASRLVARDTRAAVYATDAAGMPTLQRVKEAMRDAVLVQVQLWHENGVKPGSLAAAPQRVVSKSRSEGSASQSLTYESNGAADAALNALRRGATLDDTAWTVLDDAGLLSSRVRPARGRSYGV